MFIGLRDLGLDISPANVTLLLSSPRYQGLPSNLTGIQPPQRAQALLRLFAVPSYTCSWRASGSRSYDNRFAAPYETQDTVKPPFYDVARVWETLVR